MASLLNYFAGRISFRIIVVMVISEDDLSCAMLHFTCSHFPPLISSTGGNTQTFTF